METVQVKLHPKSKGAIDMTDSGRLELLVTMLKAVGVLFTETKEDDGTVVFTVSGDPDHKPVEEEVFFVSHDDDCDEDQDLE